MEVLPAFLGNLSSLKELNLSNCGIESTIPAELGNLSNLEILQLNNNIMYGEIPATLGNLTQLEKLDDKSNFSSDLCFNGGIPGCPAGLSGNIPGELGNLKNLTYLSLRTNKFEGNIPNELVNLNQLTTLYLAQYLEPFIYSDNNLKWDCSNADLLPFCDQLLNTDINYVYFPDITWDDFCATNGEICSENTIELCNAADVAALKAIYNNTLGRYWINNIGWSILNTQNLRADCNLGNLHGVTLNENGRVAELRLHQNNLTGNLPAEIGDLSELTVLVLASNQLRGSLPPELGNLTKLTNLGLSDNKFIGEIPPQLGNLANLIGMFLANNQFNGSIPPELGNLTNLTLLSLAQNNLTGSIPAEFSELTKLNKLTLQNNQLTGCIDDALINICEQLDFETPDQFISSGNNLDGLWTSFCQCNVGSCNTDFDLVINSNTIFQNTYQTEGDIFTDGEVLINTGQNIVYKAAITTLNEGFEAKKGAEVLITPKNCD